jgi:hypothetical protein
MPFGHDGHAEPAFPFGPVRPPGSVLNEPEEGMTDDAIDPYGRVRTAALRLRGAGRPLAADVHWPRRTPAPLLVVFGVAADLAAALCPAAGFVVLAVTPGGLADARTAVEWAAEHAGELHATAPTVLAAGGAGVPFARQVKANADRRGWPPLLGVVEIAPDLRAVSKSAALVRRIHEEPDQDTRRSTR